MMCVRNLAGARWVLGLALVVAALATPRLALADVRLEGDWADERLVTLDADATSRAHAIELLAAAAGWSVVLSSPLSDPVDLHVKDQPASKVLALLLPDGDYVARRSGALVSIKLSGGSPPPPVPAVPAAAPVSPVSPLPPLAHARGEDRTVFGDSFTVQKSDVVHDVTVFGGSVDVFGTVTGDLTVFGGSSRVHDGAKVMGSASVIGGQLHVDDGAVVERDVGVVGGHLDRGPHATVGGSKDDDGDDEESHPSSPPSAHEHRDRLKRALHGWTEDAGRSLSAAALLFVFGSVVIALGTERSRALRVEVAARPMRTFALGVVGIVCAFAVFLALCVTIIGIPVAFVGAVAFVVAAYAGVSATLTTVGEALFRHRTTSPYVHLAVGCAGYFLVKLVPWVGTWVTVVVALMGVGVIVATRCAGLLPARNLDRGRSSP